MSRLTALLSPTNLVLVANAGSLVGTTAAMSGLGYVYWLLAARHFSPEAVGLAGASVSAMLLLGSLSVLGLGTLLIGELPRQPGSERALITTAILVAGSFGAALGVLFALLAARVTAEFEPLSSSPASIALFAAGVGVTAVTAVIDRALIGLLRGGLQFGRSVLFAASKLGLLLAVAVWLHERQGLSIYATWVAGQLISLAALAAVAAYRRRVLQAYLPSWRLVRGHRRAAIQHHALNIALHVPLATMPLIVTTMLSASMNAYFYMANMISVLLFAGSTALTTALYAVGARSPAALRSTLRLSLGISLVGGALANLLLWVGAGPVLSLFGKAYAEHAETCLRILGLGLLPAAVKDHYVAICRIRDGVPRAARLASVGAALEILLAALGAGLGGLPGLSLGWVTGMWLQSLIMAGPVVREATGWTGRSSSAAEEPARTAQASEEGAKALGLPAETVASLFSRPR